MKRALLVSSGTIAGLVAVMAYSPGEQVVSITSASSDSGLGAPLEGSGGLGGPAPEISESAAAQPEQTTSAPSPATTTPAPATTGPTPQSPSAASQSSTPPAPASSAAAPAAPSAPTPAAASTSATPSGTSSPTSTQTPKPTPTPTPTPTKTIPKPTKTTPKPTTTTPKPSPTTPKPTSSAPQPTPTTTTTPTPTPTATTADFVGPSVTHQYGTVKVAIRVTNGKVVDAWAVIYPQGTSTPYSQLSIPTLRSETIKSGSASIAAVSGATLTSQAWITSLSGALAKAGL